MTAETTLPREHTRSQSIAPLFIATLFLSATLLFAVQPMFAKMVLPRLGGAPGVWSVAIVFFQAVLLLGYLYAHLVTRFFSLRTGAIVQIVVLAFGLLFLPLALSQSWGQPPEEGHIVWLLGLFGVSVGIPFFALSANAPLLQAWFARSGGGRDPYFLYGASNLGSFIALIGYPLVVEPWLRLGTQSIMWSVGYLALAIMVAITALVAVRRMDMATVRESARARVTMRERLSWIVFAFVPSALLVAVTAHISTDIAAAPFLWVVPLSIFLLSFVLVFRERTLIGPEWFAALLPAALVFAAVTLFVPNLLRMPSMLVLHLATYFIAVMVAHGRLYAARPAPSALTEFYLWMSFGGVLGGAFAGLLAPQIFTTILEYPLLLAAALALLIVPAKTPKAAYVAAAVILVLALGLAGLQQASGTSVPYTLQRNWTIAIIVIGTLVLFAWRMPVVATALFAALLVVGTALKPSSTDIVQTRSFFGVHRIADVNNAEHRVLYHGTTIHGAQRLRNGRLPIDERPDPLTYYDVTGPLAEVTRALRNNGWRLSPVALVGLGAGAMSCHREEGETWEFFEIDREVVRLARDPRYFSFVSSCNPDAPITIGDARVTLQNATRRYELIVVDAFSSDAIPIHLLTREAVQLYFDRMQDHGVVALHVSNRHLDLLPVVAAIAQDLGLVAWWKHDRPTLFEARDFVASSVVAVLARKDEDLGSIPADGWDRLEPEAGVAAWTDDYSNILGAMIRRMQQGG